MQELETLVVTAEVQASIRRLVERLGVVRVENSRRWQPIVDQLDFGSTYERPAVPGTTSTVVVVGLPADVLKRARDATDTFGFVMPVARIATSRIPGLGQRARSWRDDATLDLWHAGWSPLNIDRLLVTTRGATVELVIGDVRPIPEVQVPND